VSALIPLMNHADAHIRNSAVYALGKIGDRAATAALVGQIPKVREARMLNNIAFALERLNPPAFFSVAAKLAEHRQAAIRMNTAFVLGDVRRNEGIPLLAKALGDKNDMVRVSAVHALGQLDSKDVEPLLTPLVNDTNVAISHEAIYGIYQASGNKNTALLYTKLYASGNPQVKNAAMQTLMENNDPRVVQDALNCIEAGNCPFAVAETYLRQSHAPEVPGRMMLEWTSGNPAFARLVATLKPQGAAPLAASWISKGLARGDTRMLASATEVAGLLHDRTSLTEVQRVAIHDHTLLRLRGLVALAGLGEPAVEVKIATELDNLAESHLYRAAQLLAILDVPDARARLLPLLSARMKAGSPRLALAAAAVHLAWDPDAGIFRMLDGLASANTVERTLAFNYLRGDKRERITWLLRRAVAREGRPYVADTLRTLIDARP
jgi:HEAT repeats/PBS lyase HEAT-like repeat